MIHGHARSDRLRTTLRSIESIAPDAEVIPPVSEEVSLAAAVNHGTARATRPLIMFVEAGAVVDRTALSAMLERFEDPRVGAVGPTLVRANGARDHGFGALDWPNWRRITRPTAVPLLSFGCVIVRSEIAREDGGLREDFLVPPNAEREWCSRLTKRGHRLELVPQRVVRTAPPPAPSTPLVVELQRAAIFVAKTLAA